MVDVTISIVHASQPELTLGCLESLERSDTTRCTTEVVVLDNACGDNLASLISERLPSSNVRVIEQAFRAGFGANHNTVIRATSSRYVLVLNPDTRVPPRTHASRRQRSDRLSTISTDIPRPRLRDLLFGALMALHRAPRGVRSASVSTLCGRSLSDSVDWWSVQTPHVLFTLYPLVR
jgi:hypothetical protein